MLGWSGEYFLCRDISNKRDALLIYATRLRPNMAFWKLDCKIRPGGEEMKCLILFVIECHSLGFQSFNMLFPGRYRVLQVGSHRSKNGFPQLVNLLRCREIREYFGCPSGRRTSHTRPAHFIRLLILSVLGHRLTKCTLMGRDPRRINTFHQIRAG
ncbi:hypothetical protein D3C74_366790 [compost metagenome]